ncbi:MAG: hypothetical protein COU46_01325, partial [Candidatus Niyogibacteria bacterium CG10_big_fil_rev_8_21_14_0_10_42_19]
ENNSVGNGILDQPLTQVGDLPPDTTNSSWSGAVRGTSYDCAVVAYNSAGSVTSNVVAYTAPYWPSASFSYSPVNPSSGITITLNDTSNLFGFSATSRSWTFDTSGGFEHLTPPATGSSEQIKYSDAGTYTEIMRVDTSQGFCSAANNIPLGGAPKIKFREF